MDRDNETGIEDNEAGIETAAALLRRGGVVMLTGAGLSTDSGIPDYRGPDSPPRRPMTFADFTSGASARQRYWSRSHVGWRRMVRALPNAGHRAVAALEARGRVSAVITQNVDRLHVDAGSRRVVELHGRIDQVVCLGCGEVTPRRDLDRRLGDLNPGWEESHPGDDIELAPDGDAAVDDSAGFVVVACRRCGGVLKPDLVFFGENVPVARVAECYRLVGEASALLVAGSSLTVFSGRRFVRRAHDLGLPVILVNRGPSRGDAYADVRIEGGCSQVLASLAGIVVHTSFAGSGSWPASTG